MITLTRPQRVALKRLYDRAVRHDSDLTYRAFRRTVRPYFGQHACVLVPFAGMWIGIEKDGYTHS